MLDIRENLDAPLWGAEAIGREAGLTHEDGTVNSRAVYYAFENGHLPASKIGKRWVSTLRRLRSVFAGDVSAHTAA